MPSRQAVGRSFYPPSTATSYSSSRPAEEAAPPGTSGRARAENGTALPRARRLAGGSTAAGRGISELAVVCEGVRGARGCFPGCDSCRRLAICARVIQPCSATRSRKQKCLPGPLAARREDGLLRDHRSSVWPDAGRIATKVAADGERADGDTCTALRRQTKDPTSPGVDEADRMAPCVTPHRRSIEVQRPPRSTSLSSSTPTRRGLPRGQPWIPTKDPRRPRRQYQAVLSGGGRSGWPAERLVGEEGGGGGGRPALAAGVFFGLQPRAAHTGAPLHLHRQRPLTRSPKGRRLRAARRPVGVGAVPSGTHRGVSKPHAGPPPRSRARAGPGADDGQPQQPGAARQRRPDPTSPGRGGQLAKDGPRRRGAA